MSSVPTITFDVRPSRWLTGAVVAVSVLAVVAVCMARIGSLLQLALGVVVLAYAAYGVYSYWQQPVRHATWHADGSWILSLAGEGEVGVRLTAARRLGPLMFLHFARTDKGHVSLTVLPDNVAADTRRHLRMRLKAHADRN